MTDRRSAVREVLFNDGGDDGWVAFPLQGDGGVQFSDLARFQPKILFGDPSKDDNDLLSSWQMDDFGAGSGVYDLKEGTDAGRFFMSTMQTRFPGQLTKGEYVLSQGTGATQASTGDKYILGEIYGVAANEVYLVYMAGLNVRRGLIMASNGEAASVLDTSYANRSSGNLTSVPVQKGVNFQGTGTEELFFIPQGNNGYATITETSVAPTEYASPKFKHFAIWDNKLIGITTGGRLYKTTDGTTWVAFDLTYALSESYYIRGLVNFFDRRDEPCIFVITGRDMWQFDPDGPELFRIDFGWPTHPHHGEAFAVWQGQLYIAVGMGVFRYTSGTWMPVGLDRDDGLPLEYQGYIKDLIPGYNGLYAIVQAQSKGSPYGAISSVQQFSGSGWHTVWTQDTAVPSSDQYHATLAQTAYTMSWGAVTRSGGAFTLAFSTQGSDDQLYFSALSTSFANPRAGFPGQQRYAGTGLYYFHESGEFDADMLGYIKVANAYQVYVEEPDIGLTDEYRDTLRVLYRADRGDWTLLARQLARPGRYAFPFGAAVGIDKAAPGNPETVLYQGLSFERIQFRTELFRNTLFYAYGPSMISNQVFSFLKTVSSNDSFQLTVNCAQGSGDLEPQALMDYIDALTSVKRFCLMKIGEYVYRVFVAQNGGTRYGSDTQQGLRSLSVVEISSVL